MVLSCIIYVARSDLMHQNQERREKRHRDFIRGPQRIGNKLRSVEKSREDVAGYGPGSAETVKGDGVPFPRGASIIKRKPKNGKRPWKSLGESEGHS